jgi:hypothetical protein
METICHLFADSISNHSLDGNLLLLFASSESPEVITMAGFQLSSVSRTADYLCPLVSLLKRKHLDLNHFDNRRIDIMQFSRKNTIRSKNASLAAICVVPFRFVSASRCLATMTINAFGILAKAAIATGGHTSHNAQSLKLGFRWDTLVLVGAFVAIRTLFAQIVDIAHLEFADAIDFGFVKIAC